MLMKDKISPGWFRRFRERNQTVSLRQGDSMASVRLQCTTMEVIDEYYDLLETVLTEHELFDKPGQIYNVDETGVSLDPPKQKVCAKRDQKKVRQIGSGNRSNITVVASVSATGHILPPFVIFEGKISTMPSQKVKYQAQHTVPAQRVGSTRSCSSTGFPTTFSAMLLEPGHCFCLWMATAVITSPTSYDSLGKMMLRFFASLPIPALIASLWM